IADMPGEFWAYEMLGIYYVEAGETDRAAQIVEQFMEQVRTGPSFLKAQLLLARIHYRKQNLDKALELADEILQENPADAAAHRLKGGILLLRGDFQGAITEYRAVLRQDPQNIQASLYIARAHLLDGEMSLAENTYKKILEMHPNEQRAHFGLVEVYRRKGETTAAKRQLEMVLEVNPDDTETLMRLGDMALSMQDTEAAHEYFNRLSALHPDSGHYNYYKEGMVKLLEGKDAEAASLFEKSLQVDPDFIPALNQLINMLVKEKRLEKAFQRCRDQIARSPDNPRYYVLLGKLYMMKDDHDGARKAFEEGLEIDPSSPDVLLSLAKLAKLSGSLDEAIARYQSLMEKYPKNLGVALV
ncbi:unnamed protein product, partial [marine sediment metagenome]